MKTRPILFSAPMVRALLAGTKTQTRRIIRDAPDEATKLRLDGRGILQSFIGDMMDLPETHPEAWHLVVGDHGCETPVRCPYGVTGDSLWVREKFCQRYDDNGNFVYNAAGNLDPSCCYYAATCDEQIVAGDGDGGTRYRKDGSEASPWTPSIHMPRWASRLTLAITDVRVERLQDISEADAIAEGLSHVDDGCSEWGIMGNAGSWSEDPRVAYRALWESINGPGSWDLNPWVWVLAFKRVEQGAA
jgi:hypothetical protein